MGQQKRGHLFKSERKKGFEFFCEVENVLRLTESGTVSECFCEIELGLRIFLSEEKREDKLDLEKFCPIRRKGVGLKIICLSKTEKESKVKQVRRKVRSRVR